MAYERVSNARPAMEAALRQLPEIAPVLSKFITLVIIAAASFVPPVVSVAAVPDLAQRVGAILTLAP